MEKISLTKFITTYYNNIETRNNTLELLSLPSFCKQQDWHKVYNAKLGEGIYSPKQQIVAVANGKENAVFYQYDPNAWKMNKEDVNNTEIFHVIRATIYAV